jgi:hypothetical protein
MQTDISFVVYLMSIDWGCSFHHSRFNPANNLGWVTSSEMESGNIL